MIVRLSAEHIPLAAQSVDMIMTDPPYLSSELHKYRWLAKEAARVLRPGGFVAAMCGDWALNHIMRWFDDAGLRYYWRFALELSGIGTNGTSIAWRHSPKGRKHNRPVTTRHKNVLVYSRGQAAARTAMVGVYRPGRADKRWHHWGQDIDSHRYYIECLTFPGDLVLDPFAGGGTTAVACELLGRRWVVGDIDPRALDIIHSRLAGNVSPTPLFADANPGERAK